MLQLVIIAARSVPTFKWSVISVLICSSDLHPAVWKYLSSVRKQSWQLSDNRLLLLMRSSPPGPALVVGEVGDCEVWCHHRCQPRPICQIFLLNFNFTPATCLCRPDPPQHKHCRAHPVIYCILQIAFCLFHGFEGTVSKKVEKQI